MIKRIHVEPTEASLIYEREFPNLFKFIFPSKKNSIFYTLASWLFFLFYVAVCAGCAFGVLCVITGGLKFLSKIFGWTDMVLGIGFCIVVFFIGIGLLYVILKHDTYFRYMAVELEERRFARKENLPHDKFSVTILGQGEHPLTWLNLEDIKNQRIRIQVTPIDENSIVLNRKKSLNVIQEKKTHNHFFLKFILLSFSLHFLGYLPEMLNPDLQWLSQILTAIAGGLVIYFTLNAWSKQAKKDKREKERQLAGEGSAK